MPRTITSANTACVEEREKKRQRRVFLNYKFVQRARRGGWRGEVVRVTSVNALLLRVRVALIMNSELGEDSREARNGERDRAGSISKRTTLSVPQPVVAHSQDNFLTLRKG